MQIYMVGGAVRDRLLGLPVQDHDWVVVGATPEDMVARGFVPVGRDFPVFLHPASHEEYALARTERKTAPGYHGFQVHAAPDVTLEDDLHRRDLTINAMARDAEINGDLYTVQTVDGVQGSTITGMRSRYIVEDRRADPTMITASGFMPNARGRSPCANAWKARVMPQPAQ